VKILLLCNKFPYPANDGSSIAIARMIEGYAEAGVKLTVLSLNTLKHRKDPDSTPKGISEKVVFHVVNVDTNPTTRNALFNLIQKLPFHVSRFFQREVDTKLSDVLTAEEFDIIHFEGIFMMPYFQTARKLSSARVVLRTHNVEYQIWKRASKSNKKPILSAFLLTQTRKLRRYERWCATVSDAIVAITEQDASYFREFNPNTISVPCGVNDVRISQQINNKMFFHLGSMDWLPNQQGVEWLLEAVWPKVQQSGSDLELHLAGRNMPAPLLKMKKAGVVVHGEIQDAPSFRQSHGVMLVPLQAGSGMRVKIVEAMTEGIPIISTSIGAEGIPLVHGESFMMANDADQFAESIIRISERPDLCRSIGKNAALLAEEKFLNKNLIKHLLGFYQEIWNIS
jgi:glycosyltransferase involved in cell wall biosynthesis